MAVVTPPPDPRGKAPRDKGFDAVWVDLLDGASGAAGGEGHDAAPEDVSAPEGGTKIWDDAARASRDEAAAEAAAEPEPEPAETRIADAGELARKAQEAFALREMERIMKAASLAPASTPTTDPAREDEAAEQAPEREEGAERDEGAEQAPERDEDATRSPERDEGAEQAPEPDDDATQAPEPEDDEAAMAHDGPKAAVDDGADDRATRDAPPASSPPATASSSKAWAVVAVTAIAIGIGWALTPPSDPPRPPSTIAKAPPAAPIPPKGGARVEPSTVETPRAATPPADAPPAEIPPVDASANPGIDAEPDAAHATTGSDESADADASGAGHDDATGGSGGEHAAAADRDPREPPEGTPEPIAAVFRKLPVSAADRPPVGGIGASGIHVDRISMGSEYDGDCKGKSDAFSASAGERPSVCVRVVHPREREELAVHWQRKGGSTRRGKITVKPLHAYRTRAYLVLRKEDVGDWTVRILSSDGVELASHDFSVAP